jgi:hypothetical protein
MSRTTKQLWQTATRIVICASLPLLVCAVALAQSTDLGSPTPIYTGEIAGRIAPLDIGDSRLTRHFYTFNARPGDLELAVEANNLEGDIDLFAANTMRPLAKVTLYAGLGSNVTRTVFFRRDEAIILRVQARSPNDTDGTYNIRLGGTFAPSTAPLPDESARNSESAPAASSREKPAGRGVRRVNSVGARIEEPKPEVTTEPAAPERTEAAPTSNEAVTTPTPVTTSRTTGARGRAARRAPARRGAAQRGASETNAATREGEKSEPGKAETAEATPAKTEPANNEATGNESSRNESARSRANTNRSRTGRGRSPRAGDAGNRPAATTSDAASSTETTAPPSNESPAAPTNAATGLEAPGSRIVLELRDGTLLVRAMSEVRRVAIEGRIVVIVLKSGRVERQPLANIQRMSIEP